MDLQTPIAAGIVTLAAAELLRRATLPWRIQNSPDSPIATGCGSCAQCPSSQAHSGQTYRGFGSNQATTPVGLVSLQLPAPPARQP